MSLGFDYLDSLVEDDKEKGIFRCKREMFTDERLFELEMKHIFEGNWIYLAHESQIPEKNDYYTTQMGRQPIFIARNKDGELNAFINACSHRGAMLCRFKSGNKATYTCPFHGWTFNNSGKLLKVKDPKEAGYPDSFNCDGSHDLKKIARFESYRGFLFGSLREDVASLEEFLGESRKIIDMVVDQSPDGIEVLRGSSSYVFGGNWKLTAENGADGYHVTAVHWNYAATQNQRKLREAGEEIRTMSAGGWGKKGGGFYSFENGHLLLWTRWDNPEDRPLYSRRDELVAEVGEARADWMIGNSRNLCLYPNLYLMDQYSRIIASKLLCTLANNIRRETLSESCPSFGRITDYIDEHLKKDISVEQLAELAHMSPRSLYVLFERKVGTTPKSYIRQRKLEQIHGRLSDPSAKVRNITEIAMDYGFMHLGRFSESYKSTFGELPSDTLRRHH